MKTCVALADRFVSEQGFCVLAYDVVGSTKIEPSFFDRKRYQLRDDLNERFKVYFHPGYDEIFGGCDNIGIRGRFDICFGDSASACIGSAEGVEKIILYHKENYKDFPVRWVVVDKFWRSALKRI